MNYDASVYAFGRPRRERARQGDERAKNVMDDLSQDARQQRQNRVHDAASDPIGAYLTIVDWLERCQRLAVERYDRGREIPFVQFIDDVAFWVYGGTWRRRYMDQLARLETLRDAVLIEGCRLGVSSVEMSRLISEIKDAVEEFPSWVEFLSKGEYGPLAELENKLMAAHKTLTPLRDLKTWKAAGNKPSTSSSTAVHPITLEEANRRAMELAQNNPSLFKTIKARELSKLIGCSVGLVIDLPFWRHLMEKTGRGRKGRATLPKAISFTDNLENTIGEWDEELQRLAEEQKADDRQQRIRSRERI